jgi:hypothetical protein
MLKKKRKKKTSKIPAYSLKKIHRVLSILLSPNPLGFCRPNSHLCHPSLNAVAVTIAVAIAVSVPPNVVAIHSSTCHRHIATVGLPQQIVNSVGNRLTSNEG